MAKDLEMTESKVQRKDENVTPTEPTTPTPVRPKPSPVEQLATGKFLSF